MKIQTLGLLAAVGALAVASAGSLMSCSQPPIQCQAAHGDFVVEYINGSGDAACNTKDPELVGFQLYSGILNKDNCEQRADDTVCDETGPDVSVTRLAIQAFEIGATGLNAHPDGSDTTHKMYSIGDMQSTEPDANDFCYVPTLTAGEVDLPDVPPVGAGGTGGILDPGQTATNVKYEWSNVKIYVTAAAPGTQVEADLKYTKDGCEATFKAIGIYPPADCGVYDPDTGALVGTDITLCSPKSDVAAGRPFGSGINEDFPTKCVESPSLGAAFCLLDGNQIPVLK